MTWILFNFKIQRKFWKKTVQSFLKILKGSFFLGHPVYVQLKFPDGVSLVSDRSSVPNNKAPKHCCKLLIWFWQLISELLIRATAETIIFAFTFQTFFLSISIRFFLLFYCYLFLLLSLYKTKVGWDIVIK